MGRLRGAESADEFAGWRDLPPRLHASEPPAWPLDLARLLHRLRLPHVREAGPAILARAQDEGWDYAQVLKVLLAEEAAGRDRSTRELHRREARLPSGKTFEAWDPKASAIPDEAQWALRSLDWMGRAENLVLVGPSGTGKSHFAEAIAHAAIDRDLRVSWFSLESLTATIARSRIDTSTGKVVERIVRSELVVVDDIGLLPAGAEEAEALYRLVDAAYEKRSLIVTSNLHPARFDTIFPRGLATAAVDRLLHHAHVIRHRGPIASPHRSRRGQRRPPARPCSMTTQQWSGVHLVVVGGSDVHLVLSQEASATAALTDWWLPKSLQQRVDPPSSHPAVNSLPEPAAVNCLLGRGQYPIPPTLREPGLEMHLDPHLPD